MHEPAAAALSLRELVDLVYLHSGAQGLDRQWVDGVLRRIGRPHGCDPDAWAPVWTSEASAAQSRGDWALALRLYNLARFPFVGEPPRQEAHEMCLRACREVTGARHARSPVTRMELALRGRRLAFYLRRSHAYRAPLLLVFGGIVSNKEQWLGFLDLADRLGMDVAVAEFPGVGENRLPLDEQSHQMVGHIIDAVQGAGSQDCFVVALSFGGTLALRQAARDPRIRGIATVGAPVRSFFEDAAWWARIPSTTRLTLQHILGVPAAEVRARLAPLALSPAELACVHVPVHYVQCARDEIIQGADAGQLSAVAGPLQVLRVNDVHGAPHHLSALRLFIAAGVLCTMRPGSARARLLGLGTAVLARLPAFHLLKKPQATH